MTRIGTRPLVVLALGLASTSALGGAVASNYKKETRKGANYWNAQAAIDGNLESCWMVPGESTNRGEYLMLDVPKSTVDKVAMVVGWARDEDTFKDYARVKKVRVEAFKPGEGGVLVPAGHSEAEFKDEIGMQVVDIDDLVVGDDLFGGKVKVAVVDIYEGRDFPNMAISELVLWLSEFDAAAQVSAVSGEAPSHARDLMLDDNPKTFWQADAEGASITFEAPGFSVSQVGLMPGPADFSRPKKVEVSAAGRTHVQELPDSLTEQWILIPPVVGYTGSAWGEIAVKIVETWPGTKYPDQLAIAELDLKATAYEGL